MAYDATRKIVRAVPKFSEVLFSEFRNFLSHVGERISVLKSRYECQNYYFFFL